MRQRWTERTKYSYEKGDSDTYIRRKFVVSLLAVLCVMTLACASCSAAVYADITCTFRGSKSTTSKEGAVTSTKTVYHGGQVWFDIDGNTATKTFKVALYLQKESPTGLWFYTVDELTLSSKVTLDNTSSKQITTKKAKKTSSVSNTITAGTNCRYKTVSKATNAFNGHYRNVLTTSKSWK